MGRTAPGRSRGQVTVGQIPTTADATALHCCNISLFIETTFPFEETRNDHSNIRVDLVTSPKSDLSNNPRFKHRGLVLDVKISNPCAPRAIDASPDILGSALAKVISQKHHDYSGP